MTRAGNRRYYRPEDVALVRRIDQALNRDGYTIRGVQQLLKAGSGAVNGAVRVEPAEPSPDILARLIRVREALAAALAE